VPLLFEAGYGCSLSVASNVFVRTKPYLLFLNKNNAPHECGNPKCKAIALLLAIERTIPSRSSTSAGCFACKQDSGRAIASGIRRQCRTAPTRMRRARQCSRKGGCAVHQLAHSWLLERLAGAQFYPCPNCPLNFRALASRVSVSATRSYQQFLSQSCKNP
jgi:hypothetical protein